MITLSRISIFDLGSLYLHAFQTKTNTTWLGSNLFSAATHCRRNCYSFPTVGRRRFSPALSECVTSRQRWISYTRWSSERSLILPPLSPDVGSPRWLLLSAVRRINLMFCYTFSDSPYLVVVLVLFRPCLPSAARRHCLAVCHPTCLPPLRAASCVQSGPSPPQPAPAEHLYCRRGWVDKWEKKKLLSIKTFLY